jgi:hypothetical protein
MATHGDIGVSQPAASTITMKVRTVTVDVNSTTVHQEVLTLGGAESTLEVARVVATMPASTHYGLVTRPAPAVLSQLANSTVSATSTATVLLSSAATTPFVSAFMVTSTNAGPIVGGFYAGSTLLWPVTLWAAGGVAHVSQHVAAPGYVFAGQPGRPLEFRTPDSSGVFVRLGMTYWQG